MSIGILIITDGRATCLQATVKSLRWAWGDNPVDQVVIVNDSGDPEYAMWLDMEYPSYERVHHPYRRGFAAAIQTGWDHIGHHDYVFHLEDDFIFREQIDVNGMTEVLERNPDVAQMALKRQPWNDEEKRAGGFMELHPGDFTNVFDNGYWYTVHQRFFTTNPSFYRGSLTERGWPQEKHSEGKFGIRLLQDHPLTQFAFWGTKEDGPKVTHTGTDRVGTGY